MQRGCMCVLVRTVPFISGVLLREYKYQIRRPMAVCGKDRDLSCTERTRTATRCWDICEQTSVRPTRLDSKVIQTPVKGIHRQSAKPPVSGLVRLKFFPAEVAIFRRQPRPTAVSITITLVLIARNVCPSENFSCFEAECYAEPFEASRFLSHTFSPRKL